MPVTKETKLNFTNRNCEFSLKFLNAGHFKQNTHIIHTYLFIYFKI